MTAERAAHILGSLPGVRLLTVDFFDTLVTRSLAQPTHVFALVEQRLMELEGQRWRGLAAERVMAENRARAVKASVDPHADVTIDEIVRELAVSMGLDMTQRARIIDLEKSVEIEVARPVALGRELVAGARQSGIQVLVVSDNYMPSSHLADMARAAGIDIDAADVLVSCENGAMKRDGSLWSVVTARTGVEPAGILHLGDLPDADGTIPAGLGITAHVEPSMRSSHRHPSNTSPAVLPLSRIEAVNRDRGAAPADNLASGVLAFVVAGQVLDAIRVASARAVTAVHFTARDGWLAHEVYGAVRDQRPALPPRSYTAVSRSVVWRATMGRVDVSSAARLVGDDERLTVERLAARVGCPLEGGPEDGSEMDAVTARGLLVSNAGAIASAGEGLRLRYTEYLAAQGLLDAGHHLLVDLGWSGSVVTGLAALARAGSAGKATFEGRFMGLYWDVAANRGAIPLHGLAVDDLSALADNMRLLGSVRVWEALLSAGHGTVVDFRDASPVLASDPGVPALAGADWHAVATTVTRTATEIVLGRHPSVDPSDVTRDTVWAAMMQFAHTPREDEVLLLSPVRHETALDHVGEGSLLVAPPAPALSGAMVDPVYDRLLRGHWLQGSLARWARDPQCHWTVEEIRRRQPWTDPCWTGR